MLKFDIITETDARTLDVGSTVELAAGGHITPLAKDTLAMGDSGVGFLAGATGAGAFTGSIIVASRGSRRPGR